MRQFHLVLFSIAATLFFLPRAALAETLVSTQGAAECSSLTAQGSLNNGDRFAGKFSSLPDGNVHGEWIHQTPRGDQFHLDTMKWVVTPVAAHTSVAADPDHAEFAKFGGSGTWNNIEGYSFRVHAREKDRSSDRSYYAISIFDRKGKVFYSSKGYIAEGDIRQSGADCSSF